MSKELTTQDAAALKEWEELNNVTEYVKPNEIRLDNRATLDGEKNPSFGKLFATTNGVESEIDIDKAVFRFVASKVYVKASNYDDGGPVFRCNEVDDTRKDYIVMTLQDGTETDRGLYVELKERHGDALKYTENLYVQYEGVLYRWNITGAHFDSYFKLKKKMGRPQTFRVSGMTDQKKGTNLFKSMQFEVVEPYSVAEALTLRKELDALLTGGAPAKPAAPAIESAPKKEVEDLPWEEAGK